MANKLRKRQMLGNLRQLTAAQKVIDFASNDYLGLARSEKLSAALGCEWGKIKGLGSTGSRLLTGNSDYAQELESAIASFHGYEAGLLFNCGYMANVGVLSTVAGDGDAIYFDSGVHASTRDGIRLSRAAAFPFRHQDIAHLEERLKRRALRGSHFICVESIYSTDGSRAPLGEICRIAEDYGAHVIVDEAHAVGVCGIYGKGLAAEYALTTRIFAQVTTFGKALGIQGAIVLGSQTLKHALLNFASSVIYTTALPFYALAAIRCSYDLFPGMDEERRCLNMLIQAFPNTTGTPIQYIPVKGNIAAREKADQLKNAGFDVRPLMSPTVRRGEERLRVCLHAFNTENQLKSLLEQLQRIDQ